MSATLKLVFFFKMKAITFLRRKLSKLHIKDTIFNMTITFYLKQVKQEQAVYNSGLKNFDAEVFCMSF